MSKNFRQFEVQTMSKIMTLPTKMICLIKHLKSDRRGQGTTEYAILVGVLVVIAVIAVIAFRDNLQSLWESISESINSL